MNSKRLAGSCDQFDAALAEEVLDWRTTPERFLLGGRRWKPRWKFRPTKNVNDAAVLVEALSPQSYVVETDSSGVHFVKILIGNRAVHGKDKSKPLAICRAVAAAVGIEVNLQ